MFLYNQVLQKNESASAVYVNPNNETIGPDLVISPKLSKMEELVKNEEKIIKNLKKQLIQSALAAQVKKNKTKI